MKTAVGIATIVAAIVVITQLWLLLHNSHNALVGEQQERLDTHHLLIADNPALADLYFRGLYKPMDLVDATDGELTRLFYLVAAHLGHYETIAAQRVREKDGAWEAALRGYMKTVLYAEYWKADGHTFVKRFAGQVCEMVGSDDCKRLIEQHRTDAEHQPLKDFVQRMRTQAA